MLIFIDQSKILKGNGTLDCAAAHNRGIQHLYSVQKEVQDNVF